MDQKPARLPYYPALNGLRGVAVAAVVLFHGGFVWARGGFLGVSTFFTLSGFLITSLLLVEKETTGNVALRRFWIRRFRRLMPAALVTLAFVVVFGATVAEGYQLGELRADVLSALAYVANWRFVLADQSYADLFAAPSPVQQFWSLAVEEQIYIVFPLVTVGLLALTRGSRARLAVWYGALIAVSLGLALFAGFGQDRIYYGTDTRAAELLVGSMLAVFLTGRTLSERPRQIAGAAGTVALIGLVVAYSTVGQTTDWLFQGGLGGFGLTSGLVVLAVVAGRGPVPVFLRLRPLMALGRISYGVYLYHWVIFLWLTPARTGLDTWPLFALRLTVTLAAASASYVLLEQPIRRGRLLSDRQALVAGPVTAVAIVVALLAVTWSPPRPAIDFAAAEDFLASTEIVPAPEGFELTSTIEDPPPAPPPRVAVFGDSTALMTAVGLTSWMDETGLAVPAGGSSWLGCGVGRGGERRTVPGDESPTPDGCDNWAVSWAEAIEVGQPDIAVVQVGPWEVADRRLEGDDTWRSIGDPVYDKFLKQEMLEATDVLSAGGAEVVWLLSPAVGPGESGEEIERRGAAADPARMAGLNEIMAALPEERPGVAHVVDLGGYVNGADDIRLRPDGVHFSAETAQEVAADFLGPELLNIFGGEWIDRYVDAVGLPAPDELRVLVVGDSTALMVGFGLNDYATRTGTIEVAGAAELGCGVGRSGMRTYQGVTGPVPEECDDWATRWSEPIEQFQPHVVMMLTGPFDVADRTLEGSDTPVAPGDPVYDDYLRAEIQAASETLTESGALLVWLTSPLIDVGRAELSRPSEPYPASEPERMARLNEIIAEVAAANDGVATADYAGFLRSQPGGELDSDLRPDGVHLANEQTAIVGDWLGPELIRLYGEWIVAGWRR